MLDDLRRQGGDVARHAVEFSLETIATRERGGYITERMVQHRLRLLALDADLGGPGLSPVRSSSAHPPMPGDAPTSSDGATSVRLDLIVHAEGTEIVGGAEKRLEAAFVLHMDVANQTDEPVTLARPTIATSAPFEVSRWYVAGTDGTPWDGALDGHEEASIVVVGYAGAPLDATDEIFADVHFGDMVIHTNARPRRHWNEVTR